MTALAAIFGCEGARLSDRERAFFADADPWGVILFKRNCENPAQITALCDDLRSVLGRKAPIFIDQEGGPVARLRPPHWREYPAGASLGRLYERDPDAALEACRLKHRLIAHDLLELGINADCAPVMDVPQPGAHEIIGQRAFSSDPAVIAALGAAALDGLEAGGVQGVIKHIPGHGRANADSHMALPTVDTGHETLRQTDFAPFKALSARATMAMTAHILYGSLDAANPATLSESIISDVIRGGIGFDGLLMTDDLDMKALTGSLEDKTRAALAAGCDVALHCSGDLKAMQTVASACETLSGEALRRADIAADSPDPEPFDPEAGAARLAQLLAPLEAMA